MEKAFNKNIYALWKEFLLVCVTVLAAVILPQLFHAFGIITGTGEKPGQMFLPMYLPVLIFAFRSNAVSGAVAGVLSPIISFILTGMPAKAVLPFIIIELASFGFFAGLFANKKWNKFVKIFTVQFLSRIVRIAAMLISIYFISNTTLTAVAILNITVVAVPGYLLQLLIVPFFMNKRSC